MFGLFVVLAGLIGLGFAQNEFGYPCKIANCASHCMLNVTSTNCAVGQWDCLCFSDYFLLNFAGCAGKWCTPLEYSASYCEVAKQCEYYHAPLSVGPYSTAITTTAPFPVITTASWIDGVEARTLENVSGSPVSVSAESSTLAGNKSTITSYTTFTSTIVTTSTVIDVEPVEPAPFSPSDSNIRTSTSAGPVPAVAASDTGMESSANSSIESAPATELPPVASDTAGVDPVSSTPAVVTSLPTNVSIETAPPIPTNATSGPEYVVPGTVTATPVDGSSGLLVGLNTTQSEVHSADSSPSIAPTLSETSNLSDEAESTSITSTKSGHYTGIVTEPNSTSSTTATTHAASTVTATTTPTSTSGGVGILADGFVYKAAVAAIVVISGLMLRL